MEYNKTRLTDNKITFIFPYFTREQYTVLKAVNLIAKELKKILKYKEAFLKEHLEHMFILKKFKYDIDTKLLKVTYKYNIGNKKRKGGDDGNVK